MERVQVKGMRPQIEEALVELGDKLGVKFEVGNAKFDSVHVEFKLKALEIKNGKVQTPEKENFKKYAHMYGLNHSIKLGDRFSVSGDVYQIKGFKPRSRKFPVLATKVSTGASYKFPIEVVNRAQIIG